MVHLHHYAGYHAHPYIHTRNTSNITINETNNIFMGGSYGSSYGGSVFSGGGFWNGFMNGIGLGLSNMLMGGLNMLGFGLFGGGMFGGGMGMGMFPWAGSLMPYQFYGNTSAGNCNCTCHSNTDSAKGSKGAKDSTSDCIDLDAAHINLLRNKFNTLKASASPNENDARDLYKELSERKANPKDDSHKAENVEAYDTMLKELSNWAKEKHPDWDITKPSTKGTGTGTNPDATSTGTNPAGTNQTETENGAGTKAEDKNPVKNPSGTDPATTSTPKTAEDYAQEVENASKALASPAVNKEDIKEAEELYAKLPEGEDKDALGKNIKIAKAKLALKGISDNPEVVNNLAVISQTPATEKAKEYGSNVNYNGTDEVTNVSKTHDNSGKTKDTVNKTGTSATIEKSDNSSHPKTITMHDRKDITYTFLLTIDGEYLYESDQDHQIYALQKNSDGEFELVQYSYMKGYGIKDWS